MRLHPLLVSSCFTLLASCKTLDQNASNTGNCAQIQPRINQIATALNSELTPPIEQFKFLRTEYYQLRYEARSLGCRHAGRLPAFNDLADDIVRNPTRYYGHTPDIRGQIQLRATPHSIRHLLEVSGALAVSRAQFKQLEPFIHRIDPDRADKLWQQFNNERSHDEMLDSLVPVFQKYFTEQDLRELIELYQSPAARKYIRLQPQLRRETAAVAAQWAREKLTTLTEPHKPVTPLQ